MSAQRHKCFLDEERQCQQTCMAYAGTGTSPDCVLLQAAGGVTSFFISMAKAAQSGVKHPTSPPAPEVR